MSGEMLQIQGARTRAQPCKALRLPGSGVEVGGRGADPAFPGKADRVSVRGIANREVLRKTFLLLVLAKRSLDGGSTDYTPPPRTGNKVDILNSDAYQSETLVQPDSAQKAVAEGMMSRKSRSRAATRRSRTTMVWKDL